MRRLLACAAAPLLFLSAAAQSVPNPLICEDSIDGKPPFQVIDVACIVGCNCEIVAPTLSFLPGSVNTTCIPYCNLDCVRKDPTPAQSALAPSCWDRCQVQRATPENTGWCMYWCVDGYTDLVTATTCVPSISLGAPTTTVIGGTDTVTFDGFTNPPEWQSWYQTQTVIPRTSNTLPTVLPTTASSLPLGGAQPSTQIDLSTIPSNTSASKTSSAANGSAEADSASVSSPAVSSPAKNKAVSVSANPLLLTSLLLYLGARIVWY